LIERNRRESDDLQEAQRDGQTRAAIMPFVSFLPYVGTPFRKSAENRVAILWPYILILGWKDQLSEAFDSHVHSTFDSVFVCARGQEGYELFAHLVVGDCAFPSIEVGGLELVEPSRTRGMGQVATTPF
jgi:hypothetical protein